jgi:RNA polymerase sigma factor (sigma-70 family)
MEIDALSDEVLMQRVCARDVDAFRVLYSRYETRLFNFALRYSEDRILAEDLMQETFWRVWQGARSFDPSRGDFRRWVYRVALNVARTEFSHKRHVMELPLEDESWEAASSADHPTTGIQSKQTAARVAAALASLSPTLREVVVLRCMEGLKFREIARTTGAPVGTLKSRFHRAVSDLRRKLLPGEQR